MLKFLLSIAVVFAQPWEQNVPMDFCVDDRFPVCTMLMSHAFDHVRSCIVNNLNPKNIMVPRMTTNCSGINNFVSLDNYETFGSTTKTVVDGLITNTHIKINPYVLNSASLFYSVFLHELGHVVGLVHTQNRHAVMGLVLENGFKNEISTVLPYYRFHVHDIFELGQTYFSWYGYFISENCSTSSPANTIPWYSAVL